MSEFTSTLGSTWIFETGFLAQSPLLRPHPVRLLVLGPSSGHSSHVSRAWVWGAPRGFVCRPRPPRSLRLRRNARSGWHPNPEHIWGPVSVPRTWDPRPDDSAPLQVRNRLPAPHGSSAGPDRPVILAVRVSRVHPRWESSAVPVPGETGDETGTGSFYNRVSVSRCGSFARRGRFPFLSPRTSFSVPSWSPSARVFESRSGSADSDEIEDEARPRRSRRRRRRKSARVRSPARLTPWEARDCKRPTGGLTRGAARRVPK